MPESAKNAWAQRRRETTRTLIYHARRLTIERGLAAFTIEELCSEAAVSRRTFFNYFASKDDAVLGIPLDRSDGCAVARFLSGGSGYEELSPTLIADLAALTTARWRSLDISPESAADLFKAVDMEPKLLQRMLKHGREQEEFDIRLIERRERLLPGDPRAQVAAHFIGTLVRVTTGEYLEPGNTESFLDLFEHRLTATRDLFATQSLTLGLAR